jgi:hypothetical protein
VACILDSEWMMQDSYEESQIESERQLTGGNRQGFKYSSWNRRRDEGTFSKEDVGDTICTE